MEASFEFSKEFFKRFWEPQNRDNLIKLLNAYACIEERRDRIRLEEDIPCIYGVYLNKIKVGKDIVKRINEGNMENWWKIEENDGIVKSIKDVDDQEWMFVKVGYTHSETKTGKRIKQLMEQCKKRKHDPSLLFKIEIGSVETRKVREIEDERRQRVGTKVDQRMANQLNLPAPREWVFTTKRHMEEIRKKTKEIDKNNKEFVKQCLEDKSKIQVKEYHERQEIFKYKSKFAIDPKTPVPAKRLGDLFLKPKLFSCGLCHQEFVSRVLLRKHKCPKYPKTIPFPKKDSNGGKRRRVQESLTDIKDTADTQMEQDSNGGKRRKLFEISPDIKDKDYTQMEQVIDKIKVFSTQSPSNKDFVLSSLQELCRQLSNMKDKKKGENVRLKALVGKDAGTVTETKNKNMKETRVSKVKSGKTTSKKDIQPPKHESVLANLYPSEPHSYTPKYGRGYKRRSDRPQSQGRP